MINKLDEVDLRIEASGANARALACSGLGWAKKLPRNQKELQLA